ncbi:MAG: hypothetical protein ABII06_07495 [Pseudomonadota bacterium]
MPAAASALFVFFGDACRVWAFQVHPEPEGLYSHLLAHIFFILSMAILAFWLQKTRLIRSKGWRYMQISCLLFIFWNLDTFLGHIIDSRMSPEAIVGSPWAKSLVLEKAIAPYLYYVLKMDHLICVPAIILLFIGLRSLKAGSGENKS